MLALDTSVAVPLLINSHVAHPAVVRWWRGRDAALCGHALAETYSVLTRLPGDARVAPSDAARLLRERFQKPLVLAETTAGRLADRLAELGVAGGAVYDALVALTAVEQDVTLATRDARAKATYELLGARVAIVA